MFTVWQPALLYMKAAKQAKTKAVKEPMDMTCSKEGILIEQAGQSQEITWDQIVKVEQVRRTSDHLHGAGSRVPDPGADGGSVSGSASGAHPGKSASGKA